MDQRCILETRKRARKMGTAEGWKAGNNGEERIGRKEEEENYLGKEERKRGLGNEEGSKRSKRIDVKRDGGNRMEDKKDSEERKN